VRALPQQSYKTKVVGFIFQLFISGVWKQITLYWAGPHTGLVRKLALETLFASRDHPRQQVWLFLGFWAVDGNLCPISLQAYLLG
jgi:hypothetical protein